MSFATDLHAALAAVRGLAGSMGLHGHAVSVLAGAWSVSGGHTGDGTETSTATPLRENGQNPKVVWLNDEQVALAIGTTNATVEIGPLTPDHGSGGVAVSTLLGTGLSDDQTLHVLITGPKHPSGERYRVVEVRAGSALHYTLRCKPVSS